MHTHLGYAYQFIYSYNASLSIIGDLEVAKKLDGKINILYVS